MASGGHQRASGPSKKDSGRKAGPREVVRTAWGPVLKQSRHRMSWSSSSSWSSEVRRGFRRRRRRGYPRRRGSRRRDRSIDRGSGKFFTVFCQVVVMHLLVVVDVVVVVIDRSIGRGWRFGLSRSVSASGDPPRAPRPSEIAPGQDGPCCP